MKFKLTVWGNLENKTGCIIIFIINHYHHRKTPLVMHSEVHEKKYDYPNSRPIFDRYLEILGLESKGIRLKFERQFCFDANGKKSETKIDIASINTVGELNIEICKIFQVAHVAIFDGTKYHLDPNENLSFLNQETNYYPIIVQPRKIFVRYGSNKDDIIQIDVSTCYSVFDLKEEIKKFSVFKECGIYISIWKRIFGFN